jgi:hypothetical protein
MIRAILKSARSLRTATMQPGKWQDEHRPLMHERGRLAGRTALCPPLARNKTVAHGVRASPIPKSWQRTSVRSLFKSEGLERTGVRCHGISNSALERLFPEPVLD